MNYWLHPEAAEEHKKQVACYEDVQTGLGRRYHADFLEVLSHVVEAPDRSPVLLSPISSAIKPGHNLPNCSG